MSTDLKSTTSKTLMGKFSKHAYYYFQA